MSKNRKTLELRDYQMVHSIESDTLSISPKNIDSVYFGFYR
jgi:hypothetical protein